MAAASVPVLLKIFRAVCTMGVAACGEWSGFRDNFQSDYRTGEGDAARYVSREDAYVPSLTY